MLNLMWVFLIMPLIIEFLKENLTLWLFKLIIKDLLLIDQKIMMVQWFHYQNFKKELIIEKYLNHFKNYICLCRLSLKINGGQIIAKNVNWSTRFSNQNFNVSTLYFKFWAVIFYKLLINQTFSIKDLVWFRFLVRHHTIWDF